MYAIRSYYVRYGMYCFRIRFPGNTMLKFLTPTACIHVVFTIMAFYYTAVPITPFFLIGIFQSVVNITRGYIFSYNFV